MGFGATSGFQLLREPATHVYHVWVCQMWIEVGRNELLGCGSIGVPKMQTNRLEDFEDWGIYPTRRNKRLVLHKLGATEPWQVY